MGIAVSAIVRASRRNRPFVCGLLSACRGRPDRHRRPDPRTSRMGPGRARCSSGLVVPPAAWASPENRPSPSAAWQARPVYRAPPPSPLRGLAAPASSRDRPHRHPRRGRLLPARRHPALCAAQPLLALNPCRNARRLPARCRADHAPQPASAGRITPALHSRRSDRFSSINLNYKPVPDLPATALVGRNSRDPL